MKYRLKSPLVEAVQWTDRNRAVWPAWLREAAEKSPGALGYFSVDAAGNGYINTWIGELMVSEGEWIVCDQGRLFRYGDDEFADTYEAVDVN